MVSIADLLRLVDDYACYDANSRIYKDKAPIDNETRLIIFERFSKGINNYLIQDGKSKIIEHYAELMGVLKIEPDKSAQPGVIWIENILSKEKNDGICLHILNDCYGKQMNPEQYIQIRFENINTLDDLRKWLKQLKKASSNGSSSTLYENLLTLLEQSEEYLDDVGQLKPKGIALVVSSFPGLIMGLGAIIAAQELMAIYALFFILLKGGKLAAQNSRKELKVIGSLMQNASVLSATATTTLLVYLMRLIVWSSHQGYTQTTYAGSAALGVFKHKNTTPFFIEAILEEELRNAMANNEKMGKGITNLQLRLVAAPIEARLGQIQEQTLLYGEGLIKLQAMELFLKLLKTWDKSQEPMEEKLNKVSETLKNVLEDTKKVNNGKTAIAIKRTRDFLDYFIKNPDFIINEHPSNAENETQEVTPSV